MLASLVWIYGKYFFCVSLCLLCERTRSQCTNLHVLLGNLNILECDSTGVRGTLAHVLLFATNSDALGVAVNNETSECRASPGIGISLVRLL